MKKQLLNCLILLALVAVGFNAKAQCPTYTVTTNDIDANNNVIGNSVSFLIPVNNINADSLICNYSITNLNGTSGNYSSYYYLSSSGTYDLTPAFYSLPNGCYSISIQLVNISNTSCTTSIYSNTVCVVNSVTCPSYTLNNNLVSNTLNDPSGLYSYSVDISPSSSVAVIYNNVSPVGSYSTQCPNSGFYDYITTFPQANSHSLASNSYIQNTTLYVNNIQCAQLTSSFSVNSFLNPSSITYFYGNSSNNNYCYSYQDSMSQQIYANVCDLTITAGLIATINWPSPIPTQTYTMTTWGNGYYYVSLSNSLAQYTLTPGNYSIPVTLSTTDGSPLNYIGVNDTLFYNLNIASCGNLQGTVYVDNNLSCTQNGSEQGYYGLQVTATNSAGQVYYAWTDANGNYDFFQIPTGTYTVQYVDYYNGYTVTCANSMPHLTTVTANSVTIENFAVNCSGSFDYAAWGAWVQGSPMNGLFPGQTSHIYPYVDLNPYCNNNTTAQIKLVLTPCVKYDATATSTYTWNQTPDAIIPAITGDTVVWNNVSPSSFWYYYNYMVPVITCTNAQVGDTACFTLIVTPLNDANLTNNMITICRPIGVSYDPNYKEVSPAGTTAMGYIPPATQELTYTIHFQNTGSAPALNIYVLDTLSQNLNVNSLKIVSASHSMQPIMLNDNVVKFNFPNIMLADSTHNEPQSHGYVTYKINLKPSLPLGTQIKNTGYIYFDYNEPVVTNTTKSTLYLASGLADYNKNNNIQLYPNPSATHINIKSNVRFENYKIVDVTGREVMNNVVSTVDSTLTIPVNMLDNGSYIIYLQDENNEVYSQKFMKLASQK